ncbi:unnamed protein product [Didymodactylos carnosus]|uniref:Acyl-CoA dehydrogenase n=1 Tax=Didymodactylos carnosus TaxID=1234261 RepID=A0A813QZU0_9BILA|nr:unnamed protein product [Didymodactylos carnosus]CAF3556891.1 unnamed protein product [Didymodactylos carnosus]
MKMMINGRQRLFKCFLQHRCIVTMPNYKVNESSNEQSSNMDDVPLELRPAQNPLKHLFTHEVHNQVPPLEKVDLYEQDAALRTYLTNDNCGEVRKFGAELGTYKWFEQGRVANQYTPVLRTHDRYGHRIDEVDFHPSYHQLMEIGMKYGIHSVAWESKNDKFNPHGHLQHAASLYLLTQIEAGVLCPLSMTYAGFPVLHRYLHCSSKSLNESFPLDKLLTRKYDQRCVPAHTKQGLTLGMAMTEKQGGSDVRANTTRAYCDNSADKRYVLVGHKWFCSAPMSDGFLVLAHIQEDGQKSSGIPSCFFVPRWLPNNERNPFYIQRLKDKLGNRSNASSEIEFNGTYGWLLGKEHDGVKAIIEMVHHTRLDAATGSAALMRQGLMQATWHAKYRKAFGKKLIEHPLMKSVLVDLLLESEAATSLVMYLASAYDATYNNTQTNNVAETKAFTRIATAIAKFWICKRTPETTYEALECLGGAGFVEESMMPRLYREAPLNSIWEGSGNVICLDIIRAMKKSPETLQSFLTFVSEAKGVNKYLDRALEQLEKKLSVNDNIEQNARTVATNLALCLQASLLVRNSPNAVSDAFCSSRLGPDRGMIFGGLPTDVDIDTVMKRLPF